MDERYLVWVVSAIVAVGLAAWPAVLGWLVACKTGRPCRVLKAMK